MNLTSIIQNPWFAISGWIIGAISVVATVITYVMSKREKRLVYCVTSSMIMSNLQSRLPSLRITYEGHGEPVTDLTVSRMVIWNAGKDTIKREDTVKNSPLTILCKRGVHVLDVDVHSVSSIASNIDVKLNRDKTAIHLSFLFLEHDDGVSLQIVHTGVGSGDVFLLGHIIGAGEPRRVNFHDELVPRRIRIFGVRLPNVLSMMFFLASVCIVAPMWSSETSLGYSVYLLLVLFVNILSVLANAKPGRIPRQLRSEMIAIQ
ncbi:hypothetical protein [Aquisphaera insulae]|uniref:hypothetical protein n=1 Tax=Aquisphaera insulae TaxID=2712864 RepID=UPI0013EB5096|nr:hypothetical protein [Aquisphaera insulae]